jgi:hypothetical protein
MSFLLDNEIGTKDIQEFAECEEMFSNRKKETVDTHNMFLKEFSKVFEFRTQTEWAYCLLYDYKNSEMTTDFINILMSLANFYFDEEYVAKIDKKENSLSSIPKKQIVLNKPTNSIQKQQQEYIVSTLNILIAMNNAKLPDSKQKGSEENNFEIDYTYQIFFLLCILGKELDVQNTIIQINENNIKDIDDQYQKDVLRKKLHNLINFCKKKGQSIIQLPFNTHTSSSIIQNFVLEAKLVYENMITVDDVK